MATALFTCLAVVGALLLLVTAGPFLLGVVGAACGEWFERCPRCGHLGMTAGGELHAEGCPVPLFVRVEHAAHLGRPVRHR